MEREEWLSLQSSYIGASRAASACGIGDYGTPLSVYLELCGLSPQREQSQEMEWGIRLEAAVAKAYEDRTGRVLLENGYTIHRHPRFPWLGSTPDRLVEDDRERGVELKTARSERARNRDGKWEVVWGQEGTDQIPVGYLVQAQHQCATAGFEVVDVPVLIGGSDFRIYTVERNDALIERIIQLEGELWERFLVRNAPEVDWTRPEAAELAELLHRPIGGKVVNLDDPNVALLATGYRHTREEFNRLDKELKIAKARLVEMMGDASEAILGDGQRMRRWEIPIKGGVRKPSTRTNFKVDEPTEGEVEHGDSDDES